MTFLQGLYWLGVALSAGVVVTTYICLVLVITRFLWDVLRGILCGIGQAIVNLIDLVRDG